MQRILYKSQAPIHRCSEILYILTNMRKLSCVSSAIGSGGNRDSPPLLIVAQRNLKDGSGTLYVMGDT